MNTNDLEKFIKENRDGFDVHQVPSGGFEKVSDNLKAKSSPRVVSFTRFQMAKIAAAVLLPVLISYVLIVRINSQKIDNLTAQIADNQQSENQKMNELMEAESYYNALVEQKTKEVFNSLTDPEIVREIDNIMKEIDESYSLISADLNENVNSEQLMDAMVNCQRLKLQTLEDIFNQMK